MGFPHRANHGLEFAGDGIDRSAEQSRRLDTCETTRAAPVQ